MATDERFMIVDDHDGEHYLIPAARQAEASAYFEAVSDFWDNPPDDESIMAPDEPEWMIPIGGAVSRVTFVDPRTE